MTSVSRWTLSLLVAVAMGVGSAASVRAQAPLQLMNLKDTPTSARFPLPTSRVWPSSPGQMSICLWDDDRFAALSITIDDNCAPDHAWWTQITAQHGFKVTWFVITERPGTGSYWGTWQAFRDLRALGHQVQSHTVTHLHADDPAWPGIDAEYRESINQIEANLPGHNVTCLAYPGGTYSYLNDREVAAQYYIAARSTVGTPNRANQIDYLWTGSASGTLGRAYTDSVLFGTSSISWLGGNKYLRAWLCTHFHAVTTTEARATVAADLAYIKSQEADLWVGLFDEVVRYGQERDTAKLTTVENSAERIRFTLSDDMSDTLFDYPLTVKVRLPAGWAAVVATQGGAAAPVKIVTHDGANFALVRAVPDRGEVALSPVPPLTVSQWAAVVAHAGQGDVAVPAGDGSVEPRLAGVRKFTITLSAAVDPATLVAGAIAIVGQVSGDRSSLIENIATDSQAMMLTVTLSSPLPDADTYTVALTDVLRSAAGQTVSGTRELTLRVLAGDVDASGTVTAADILAARSQAGQAVTAANARYDLNASNRITGDDLLAIRSCLGRHLPQ